MNMILKKNKQYKLPYSFPLNKIKYSLYFNNKFTHSMESKESNISDMQDKPKPKFFSLYKRNNMPGNTPWFPSRQSQTMLAESILSGYSASFFPLIEQFQTQNDPTFCGPSTMNVVLNSLMIDPRKNWKG